MHTVTIYQQIKSQVLKEEQFTAKRLQPSEQEIGD